MRSFAFVLTVGTSTGRDIVQATAKGGHSIFLRLTHEVGELLVRPTRATETVGLKDTDPLCRVSAQHASRPAGKEFRLGIEWGIGFNEDWLFCIHEIITLIVHIYRVPCGNTCIQYVCNAQLT